MNKEELFNDFTGALIFGEGHITYAEPLKKAFAKWKRKFLISPTINYEEMLAMLMKRAGVKYEPTRLTGVGIRPPQIKNIVAVKPIVLERL